jgi:hypothetical protein
VRSAMSSVLKVSTKLSAGRVVVGIPDGADRSEDVVVIQELGVVV